MGKSPMDEFFRDQSQTILVYPAIFSVADPYKENKTITYLNPIPIKAIVTDMEFQKIQWRLPGIQTTKAKEVLIEKRHNLLIEQSYKIEIDSEVYYAWKDNAGENIQKRKEGDYYRILVYKK